MAPKTASRGGETPSPRDETPKRLVVALVRGFRGLRGQVRIELLTDRPEDRFTVGARLYLEGTNEALTIAEAMPVADGKGWWLRFRELGIREVAEDRLRDRYLEIDEPNEPREPGRWFFHEIEGTAVTSTTGEALGEVVDIYRAGGAEVFVVRGPRGEFDVPGVRGIVTELAPDRGVLVVDLENLALDARPVEDEDYVRPRDRRPKKQPKKKPSASATGPGATSTAAANAANGSPKRPPKHASGAARSARAASAPTTRDPEPSAPSEPVPGPDA